MNKNEADTVIPQWAWERAVELVNLDGSNWDVESFKVFAASKAFAAYIAHHEEPPVPEDLLAAREAAASFCYNSQAEDTYLKGLNDESLVIEIARKAYLVGKASQSK